MSRFDKTPKSPDWTGFCQAADAITAQDWQRQPAREAWSAGEIVAHLTAVQRGIIGNADRMLRKMAAPVPFSLRLHLPLWLIEARIIKRKSPVPQDPGLMAEKEIMMAAPRRTGTNAGLCFGN